MDIEKLKKFVPRPEGEETEKKENSEDIIKQEFQAKKDQIDRLSEEINGKLYDEIEKIIAPEDAEKINQLIEDANDAYNEAVQAENENDFKEARLRYDETLTDFINIRKLMLERISTESKLKPKIEEEKNELIEKESQEKEIIERIKAKFRKYIVIEDRIINQENIKSEKERNEKRISAAETRKKVYEHILSRADWDLETYRRAVESNHDKAKGFTTISDRRYEELIKIIGGEKTPPKEKDFEIIRNKLLSTEIIFKDNIHGKVSENEENRIRGLLDGAYQAYIEASEAVEDKNFDEAENRFNKAMEILGIVLSLMNEILKISKKVTDEEKEKMILSDLNKEIERMFGVVVAQRDEGKITIEQFYLKNKALELIYELIDIKTAKEMIRRALNVKGGINKEEARKLYRILEVPEDEINELIKGEEKWDIGEESELINYWEKNRDAIINFVGELKFVSIKEEEKNIIFGLIKVINNLKESKNKAEFSRTVAECNAQFGDVESLIDKYKKEKEKIIEEKWREIAKSFIPDARNKVKTQTAEDYKKLTDLTESKEFLEKLAKDESFREAWGDIGKYWGQTGGQVEIETVFRRPKIGDITSKMVEFIKKELTALGEEKPLEKKEIQFKSYADIENFLAARDKEDKRILEDPRIKEIDIELERLKEILKKAGV